MYRQVLGAAFVFAACSTPDDAPPDMMSPDAGMMMISPDAGPTCPSGQEMTEFGCAPMYPAECGAGTAAFLGSKDCQPVGRPNGSCPDGFADDPSGWGCFAIVPGVDCLGGQTAALGSTECRSVGWASCEAGFSTRRGGWGCDAIYQTRACTGTTRASLGDTSCLSIGNCNAAFPPANATLFVDPNGPSDATHFHTIQAALDAAQNGAVIAVERGTYPEALVLKSAVTIAGRCAEEVIVEGMGLMNAGLDAASFAGSSLSDVSLMRHPRGVTISAGGSIAISGVRIEAAQTAGVLASGAGAEASIVRSIIRGTRAGSISASGVRAENGAILTLEDVEISGTVGSGIAVLSMGASATASRVIVRDSPIQGRIGGTGVSVQDGTLAMTDSVVVDSAKSGIVAAAAGTRIELERVLVRGTNMFAGSAANGLVVTGGAAIHGRSVQLSYNIGGNAIAQGADSLLRLEHSTVTDALADGTGMGAGIMVQSGARLEFVDSAAIYNPSVAIGTAAGTIVLERSRIGLSKNVYATGMVVGQGGRLECEDSYFGGSSGFELQVQDSGTTAYLHKCLATHATYSVLDTGYLELDGSAIVGARDLGIFVDVAGSELAVKHSVISGGKIVDDPAGGQAILVGRGGRAVVEDSDLDSNPNSAIYAEPETSVEITHSNVRRNLRDREGKDGVGIDFSGMLFASDTAFVDNENAGIFARDRASVATLERTAFIRNSLSGVYAYGDSRVTVRDSVFEDQRPSIVYDELGVGVLSGGNVDVSGCFFRRNSNGAIELESGSSPNGTDSVISHTVITQTMADSTGFGHGVIAGNGARVRFDDVIVTESANVGLAFFDGSAIVENSLIARNATGVHVQAGSMLSETQAAPAEIVPHEVIFVQSTRILENGTRVGAGEIPLPEVF